MSKELAIPESALAPVLNAQQSIQLYDAALELVRSALTEGMDYGRIPGTEKDTLYLPGAERLLMCFGCSSVCEVIESEVDHNREVTYEKRKWRFAPKPDTDEEIEQKKEKNTGRFRKQGDAWKWQECEIEKGNSLGLYRYVVRAKVIRNITGEVVGTGVGACSTMEGKYIQSPRDSENTVLKMSKKRAIVDAVKSTFGLSARFSQDFGDPDAAGEKESETPKQQASKRDSGGGSQRSQAPEKKQPTWDPVYGGNADKVLAGYGYSGEEAAALESNGVLPTTILLGHGKGLSKDDFAAFVKEATKRTEPAEDAGLD